MNQQIIDIGVDELQANPLQPRGVITPESLVDLVDSVREHGMLEMALVENVQRADLNAIDRAKAFERLISEFALTNSEISQRIGKSPAYVSNSMRLLTLPDALKDGLLTGLITEGHA